MGKDNPRVSLDAKASKQLVEAALAAQVNAEQRADDATKALQAAEERAARLQRQVNEMQKETDELAAAFDLAERGANSSKQATASLEAALLAMHRKLKHERRQREKVERRLAVLEFGKAQIGPEIVGPKNDTWPKNLTIQE